MSSGRKKIFPSRSPIVQGQYTSTMWIKDGERDWECNSILYITTVEHDTRKYHEFIAEYCYKCEAGVTIPKAMNE